MTERELKSKRALVQYISVNCRPDVRGLVQLIALRNETITKAQFILLRKAIEHIKKSHSQGLDFVKIYIKLILVAMISDASFANAPALKSQLGYIRLIAKDKRHAYNEDYETSRCHRVKRSVMAAEVYALIYAVDVGRFTRDALNELFGRLIEMKAFVDS